MSAKTVPHLCRPLSLRYERLHGDAEVNLVDHRVDLEVEVARQAEREVVPQSSIKFTHLREERTLQQS